MASDFQVDGDSKQWEIEVADGIGVLRFVDFSSSFQSVMFSSAPLGFFDFYVVVMRHLYERKLVQVPEGGGQASWGDKISAVLFGFWILVKYKLEFSSSNVKEILGSENNQETLKNAFDVIHGYVKDCLEAADRDNNGQKLK